VPRTIAQAEALEAAGIVFDNVISIEISDETIIDRMSGRRACVACGATFHVVSAPSQVEGVCDKCGAPLVLRDDDKPETVQNRLAVYHKETEPLKDFYLSRGVLKSVDNQPTIEATTKVVEAALGI
jgi:adenylate kinase